MKQGIRRMLILLLTGGLLFAGCTSAETEKQTETDNQPADVTGTESAAETVTESENEEEQTVMNEQEPERTSALGLTVPETLYIVSEDGNSSEGMFSARVLQGVINRSDTRVYIAPSSFYVDGTDIEQVKQKILREYGGAELKTITSDNALGSKYSAFWTLFQKYQDEIKEIYIYSTEKHLIDTANIAAMLAARNQGVAVTQSLYNSMKRMGVDLPVTDVTELCGFDDSDNSVTVNKWISENMVEGAYGEAVFCLKPTGRDGGGGLPSAYDLAVSMNALIYHVDPTNRESVMMQKKLLSQFQDNIPVLGWPGLNVEGAYVENISKLGKYVVCIDWGYQNGSVWGAFPEFTAEEPITPISESFEVLPGKVYVSFMFSDGDAWHYCSKELLSTWNDQRRGEYPLAWTIPSLFAKYNPLTLRYLYDTASESDVFLQGPSGIGYMYPCCYPKEAYAEYLSRTRDALKQAGLTMVNYWDLSDNNAMIGRDPSLQDRYAEEVGVDAILLGHAAPLGEWRKNGNCVIIEELGGPNGTGTLKSEDIVNAVQLRSRNMKEDETLFFVVNVEVWGDRMDAVDKAVDKLSDARYEGKYQFVGLTDLIAAIREAE